MSRKKALFKPGIFRSDKKAGLLRKKNKFIDAFERQLKELFIIDNISFLGADKEKVFKSEEFIAYKNRYKSDYVYVYYSWANTLVKCIKEKDYFRLKTNRNKNLITEEEQKKLRDYSVAVFGMSVGSNIAYVLTQAGISKKIVLADFDELDTSNLNRIWGGIHQIGTNKAIITARKVYEDNPYAIVRVLDKGITIPYLETLLKRKEINCIVEEVDNMTIKIGVRKSARKYGVPVVMITDNGDEIVLTIERYDLGYRKIFDKDVRYWNKRVASCKSPKDFADIVINDMVGGIEKVDPRMLKSVDGVFSRELISWPQLGSAAMLGGVVAAVAIKKIVREEDRRKFVRENIRAF